MKDKVKDKTVNRVTVDTTACDGCGACIAVCPEDAIGMPDSLAEIYPERCNVCANCIIICPVKALSVIRRDGKDGS